MLAAVSLLPVLGVPVESRVLRGGTFFLHASSLRSAFRLYDRPTYNFMTFSFRVARTCP